MDKKEASGAEAFVLPSEYLGFPAVIKVRPSKSYRIPELDKHIRTVRTKNEARIMHEARLCGVRTPCIYDINLQECSITMEFMEGITVNESVSSAPESALPLAILIGETVAKLHSAKICHGDLTTSNMILLKNGELCLLDFSMGCTKASLEDIGMDLRLLERAFRSAHAKHEHEADVMLETYFANIPEPEPVRKKLEEIRNRGRYT